MQEKIYNYAFIHIPKNAGTSISNVLENTNIKYCRHWIDPKALDPSIKQIIILRDPVDRFCSSVYYTLQYYSHFDNVKNLIQKNIVTPESWANCWFDIEHPNHKDLMQEIMNVNQKHVIGNKSTIYKWHICEQILWVDNPKYILLYNNLEEDYNYLFKNKFNLSVDLLNTNKSNKLDTNLSSKNIDNILSHYNVDHHLFTLYKNKTQEERLN